MRHEHDWWPVRQSDGGLYYECKCGAVKLVSKPEREGK